jgi:sulfur relay (sulfurtransferase) DsrC/TusE family protein
MVHWFIQVGTEWAGEGRSPEAPAKGDIVRLDEVGYLVDMREWTTRAHVSKETDHSFDEAPEEVVVVLRCYTV